ncbi:MAG: hypothetical protein QXD89_00260 [Candidatus Aenigmatarchaeota archaeon]
MENTENISKIKNFLNKYKWPIFVIAAVIITSYLFSQVFIGGLSIKSRRAAYEHPVVGLEAPSYFTGPLSRQAVEQPSITPEHKIKEGDVSIKSQNADQDYEKIKNSLSSYQGNLDNYKRFEDDYKIVVSFNVKIPQDNFDKFVDYLNKNFKVVESNVRFYIVSLKKTYDELEILKKTFDNLTVYEEYLKTAQPNRENIELLMIINDKKMHILNTMKSFEREIEETTAAENFNKLSIRLEQNKKIKILDEEWGNKLRTELKLVVQDTIDSLLSFLYIIPFVLRVALYLLFGVVIIIALSLLYKFFLIIKKLLKF